MPRYEFDPTKETASSVVLPKGEYEFVIGEPKSFERVNSQGNPSFGVRYPLTVAEGDHKGKRVFFSTYYQSEGGRGMAKVFKMAALGFARNNEDEARYNEDVKGQDWSFETENQSVGEAYINLRGKRIIGVLDVGMAKDREGNETGEPQQNFVTWRPIQ